MTEKDLHNRWKFLTDYLTLIRENREEFESKLGEKGVDDLVDTILDEMILRKRQMNKNKK